jgi:hypothetical protein
MAVLPEGLEIRIGGSTRPQRDPNCLTLADLQRFDARRFHGDHPYYIVTPENDRAERITLMRVQAFVNGEDVTRGTYVADGYVGFVLRFKTDERGVSRRSADNLELLTGQVEVRYRFATS